MLSTTALARGSSAASLELGRRLEGEGVMAFSVRARMAFWDFLVPKVSPRVERAERFYLSLASNHVFAS